MSDHINKLRQFSNEEELSRLVECATILPLLLFFLPHVVLKVSHRAPNYKHRWNGSIPMLQLQDSGQLFACLV
jgi:hypothetical protein